MQKAMSFLVICTMLFGGGGRTDKSARASKQRSEAEKGAIAAIRKLGGRVEVDKKQPGNPVVAVFLEGTTITDAGLPHLKGLTKLQSLHLLITKVTDAGLIHLKGLTELHVLSLNSTQVTDAGLVHLKGLAKLQELRLNYTKVTDTGLVHLKG